jgi:hypothetical protein
VILFNYYPPERVNVLKDQIIGLTQPRAFNDPFELNPHFTLIAPQTDDSQPSENHAYFFGNEGMKKAYALQKTSTIVVLSLSARHDNQLMWAHYAASHTGFLSHSAITTSASADHRMGEAHTTRNPRPKLRKSGG